jgi:hypothetical protein
MSKIVADSLASRGGQSISVDNGVNVTGIVTATSFSGDGSNLSGIVAFDAAKVYTYNQLFG